MIRIAVGFVEESLSIIIMMKMGRGFYDLNTRNLFLLAAFQRKTGSQESVKNRALV